MAQLISGFVNDADLITRYRFSSIDLGNKAGYHCNGQLEYRKHFKDGKQTDAQVDYFNENGKLFKREYFYDNGKQKRHEYFDEQGQLKETYHYK